MARKPRRPKTPIGVVQSVLDEFGIDHEVILGRQHPKARFYLKGKKFSYTTPGSTSDGARTLKNCICGIRRLLRAEGFDA